MGGFNTNSEVLLNQILQALLYPKATSINIGTVDLDQTTPGTTNGVVINSGTLTAVTAITNALPAGSAILGKIGIDQTTPGTTNGVILNSGSTTIATQTTGTNLHTVVDSGTITTLTTVTNPVPTQEQPDATATFAPSSDLSGALEASSVSKNSAGVFYGLSGYNSLGSAQWILVYNTTSVPANGAVTPIIVIRAAATSNFSIDTGKFGVYCSTGICWSNSIDATIFNKTLGASDCFVNLQYK